MAEGDEVQPRRTEAQLLVERLRDRSGGEWDTQGAAVQRCRPRAQQPAGRLLQGGGLERRCCRLVRATAAVAGQVHGEGAKGVPAAVPQTGQRARRGQAGDVDRLRAALRVGIVDDLLVAVHVHHGLLGPRGRQRPAVPARQDLVGVRRRRVAVAGGQGGALQEGLVLGLGQHGFVRDGDRHPAAVQRVPLRAGVVPHLEPQAARHLLQLERRAVAGRHLRGPLGAVLQALVERAGTVRFGDREAGGA